MSRASTVRTCKSALLLMFIGGALPQPALAQRGSIQRSADRVSTDEPRVRRLEALADVWGTLELFHPSVALRGRFWWDSALIAAIPRAERARTEQELALVLNEELFARIGDPLSFARTQREANLFDPSDIPADSVVRSLTPGLGYLDARDPAVLAGSNFAARARSAIQQLGELQMLLVDARWQTRRQVSPTQWLGLWIDRPMTLGRTTSLMHHGTYWPVRWRTVPAGQFVPPDTSARIPVRTVVLVNLASYAALEAQLDLLQHNAGVAVAVERSGPLPEASSLFNVADSLRVRVNSPMLVSVSGALGSRPDTVVDRHVLVGELPELARQTYLASTRRPTRRAFDYPFRRPDPYPETDALPTREQRILGLVRLWRDISYFHAYLEYAKVDWPAALRRWIPRVEASTTLPEYYFTLRRVVASLNDSHVTIRHPNPTPLDSGWVVPLGLRRLSGGVTVLRVDSSARARGLRVGDVILAVDGVRTAAIEDSLRELISASHQSNFYRDVWTFQRALHGAKDSQVRLTVRGASGERSVTVHRTIPRARVLASFLHGHDTPHALLAGNVGYVNLNRVASEAEFSGILQRFRETNGLILDARLVGASPFSGDLRRMLVNHFLDTPVDIPRPGVFEVFMADGPPSRAMNVATAKWVPDRTDGASRYTKPVAVLIDERIQSTNESLIYTLKASGRALFVGSATAGTNGGTEFASLPGGGSYSYTVERVTNPGGSRFHGIGILPDVPVEPTVRGVRSGRDEVLLKALEVLTSKGARP